MGDVEGCLVRRYIWTVARRSGWLVAWKILTGRRLGGPEGSLVESLGWTPSEGIRRIFR